MEVLNIDISDNPTRRDNLYGVEPMMSKLTQEETN